ncbi:LysR family transcriptional regulator [Citrobacter sp. FDAARGOS_156]|uniref:LysR family transcriptional regulator n=1 Tax=Citrobacter TaxID=544 RepID=UPI000E1A89FD|nr:MULTISPECIES: LysR family transcriptional regulator [Citrobacter]EIS7448921.1 LysR family transcriptional regulator [Citrobacter youngae]MBJ9158876.1 LysR family transcriptional regulator [Citrobacter sp. FDAARGOS_156]SUY00855.1 LysR family transcriptional regulator [Citrobacter youngae]
MRSSMFEYMSIFVQVVEQGGFAKAADVLHLHRPAVTKAIQHLEDDLGTKLLNRTTRKVTLTEEGDAFYQRTKVLLGDVDDIMASFSPTRPPRGKLRINAPLSLAHSIIVPALSNFQSRYPDIEIVLTSTDRKIDLLAEGIDCMIRIGELQDSSLISRRLGEVKMVTCASADYLAIRGIPQTPDDLAQHQALNFFSERHRDALEWSFINEEKTVSIIPASRMSVDNSDILLTGCLSGLGIIHGVHAVLAPYLESGQLVEVLGDYAGEAKPVSVLYPDRRHLAPRVRVFIDWLCALFNEQKPRLQGLLQSE